MTEQDPYIRSSSGILAPPATFAASLRHLGPGFILSASIVGSGELIATTLMGAKAGFTLLWFIIFSCVIKVVVQLEFGKHAVSSGETTMEALNSLPGPKLGAANWSIWLWLILMLTKTLQLGGIIGAVVLGVEQLFPVLEPDLSGGIFSKRILTTLVIALSVSMLVFKGYYSILEKASLVMIAIFLVFTLASLVMLQTTASAITGSEFTSGLIPSWPDQTMLLIAIGAFGITGVGGDEILAYNYWLIEKGYASYAGPRENTEAWEHRAKGWIRVMYWDAILAMICYTLMTSMFYLLGAAILHRAETVPANGNLIEILGTMYTQTLGSGAKYIFVVGAVVVLYSTMFAALAAWTRLYADALGQIGLINFHNPKSRKKEIGIIACLFPLAWAALYLFFEAPGQMVIIGGVITGIILLLVVFAAMYFRYRRLDSRLNPSKFYDAALWTSAAAIFTVAIMTLKDAVPWNMIFTSAGQ